MAIESTTPTKQYTLVLPEPVYRLVRQAADEQHITVAELLRKFIKLGLIATDIEKNPDAMLIVREGDTERQLVLV